MTPWTVAHQAPLSMGILQARILEWAERVTVVKFVSSAFYHNFKKSFHKQVGQVCGPFADRCGSPAHLCV